MQAHRPDFNGVRSRLHGFTLVEIMLAVAITAIVFAVIYNVLGNTIRSRKRMEAYAQPSRTAQQILAIVTTDLESAFLPDAKKLGFYATADDNTVRFVSSADSLLMPDGRQGDNIEVVYVWRSDETNADGEPQISLYRRESPYVDDKPLEGGTYRLVARKLRRFSMMFYDGEEWREQWNNLGSEKANKKEEGLPVAIRITVGMNDGSIHTTQVMPLRRFFQIQ